MAHAEAPRSRRIAGLFPGLALCVLIALVAVGLRHAEQGLLGRPYIEEVVIAILLGMALRTVWGPSARWHGGIAFTAKQVLEVAVMLLGLSMSFRTVAASGALLIGLIVAIVVAAIAGGLVIGRLLGLRWRLATLIACGNAICGNSAIAALAPVIDAQAEDVASAISFTAVVGMLMVLGLPLLIQVFGLSAHQYGILAGLTVYAVPQVLAATVPVGLLSTQVGTLVKLVRVLLLGPVAVGLSLIARSHSARGAASRANVALVPWFIVGFLALATLRTCGLVSDGVAGAAQGAAAILTVAAMAALGLGVDVRVFGQVGKRVTAAVALSLALLFIMSLGAIQLFA